MKKFCYVIVGFITLFVCSNIYAKHDIVRDKSTLLGKCQYEAKNSQGELKKIIIDISKDYNIYIAYENVYEDPNVGSYNTSSFNFNFTYEKFIDEKNVLDCKNVDTVYYCYAMGTANSRQVHTSHYIQPDKKEGAYCSKYSLNKSASEIYVSKDYEKKKKEEEGWLKICHYGNYYLKFNKEKYETNIVNIRTDSGMVAQNLDVMSYLNKNNYSCPTSLCSSSASAQGYTATWNYFKMEYDPSCIVSQDYESKYRCGSLDSYMEEYNKLKGEEDIASLTPKIEEIKKFCGSVSENQNYTDPTQCVKECIEISEIFNKDINLDGDSECGLSSNLIKWLKNILKWIKYILPVLVIILGIIDFIKAISSGSDDEMKKAQGRFIKRLIAAALLFLVPALIEFILNVFNIESAFCGIID